MCVALEVPEIAPLAEPKKQPTLQVPPPSQRSVFATFFRGPGEVEKVPAEILDGTKLTANPTKCHRQPYAKCLTVQ